MPLQRPYLGHRKVDPHSNTAGEYAWVTYREAGEARTAIGSGLVYLGVTPGSTVGIYSINSVGKFFFFFFFLVGGKEDFEERSFKVLQLYLLYLK